MKTKLLRVSPADEMLASVICVQTICVNLFVHAYIIYIYIYVAVDGGWDEWSEWTVCSSQCERQRSRECNSPAPRHRGKTCEGNSEATENCTDGLCTQSKAFLPAGHHHHHHHFPIIIIMFTLTVTWQIITSMFEQEVCFGKEKERSHSVDWHRCPVHDNVSALLLCAAHLTYCVCHPESVTGWEGSADAQLSNDAWRLEWNVIALLRTCTCNDMKKFQHSTRDRTLRVFKSREAQFHTQHTLMSQWAVRFNESCSYLDIQQHLIHVSLGSACCGR